MHEETVLDVNKDRIRISNENGPAWVTCDNTGVTSTREPEELPIDLISIFWSDARKSRGINPGDKVKVQEASGGGFGYPTLFFN